MNLDNNDNCQLFRFNIFVIINKKGSVCVCVYVELHLHKILLVIGSIENELVLSFMFVMSVLTEQEPI